MLDLSAASGFVSISCFVGCPDMSGVGGPLFASHFNAITADFKNHALTLGNWLIYQMSIHLR